MHMIALLLWVSFFSMFHQAVSLTVAGLLYYSNFNIHSLLKYLLVNVYLTFNQNSTKIYLIPFLTSIYYIETFINYSRTDVIQQIRFRDNIRIILIQN